MCCILKYVRKEEKSFIESLKYIKDSAIILIKTFRNYNSFILFLN